MKEEKANLQRNMNVDQLKLYKDEKSHELCVGF